MYLKPIIKCAGGKSWLAPSLTPVLCSALAERDEAIYLEPFAGGAAVALALGWPRSWLMEYHAGIVALYQSIVKHKDFRTNDTGEPTEATFLAIRDQYNNLDPSAEGYCEKKARGYWYLNHTCFNGLHRENKDGKFNVPWNKTTRSFPQPDLVPYHSLMQHWMVQHCNAVSTLTELAASRYASSCVVFADPPYDDGFVNYVAAGFSWLDQVQAAVGLARMAEQGAAIVATNAWTPRIINLYHDLGFAVYATIAPRRISSDGNRDNAYEMIAGKNIDLAAMTGIELVSLQAWQERAA
jgi:DNA adenine methylase